VNPDFDHWAEFLPLLRLASCSFFGEARCARWRSPVPLRGHAGTDPEIHQAGAVEKDSG
jgi:hypothetical protein